MWGQPRDREEPPALRLGETTRELGDTIVNGTKDNRLSRIYRE